MAKVGRPLKFKTLEELIFRIEEYFNSCDRPMIDKFGNIIKDKEGNVLTFQYKPYTIGGLADSLDMTRQSLLNYQNKDEFFDTIMRAKRKCEVYAEERLFDRDGVNGAKFTLINNYENWKDKTETDINAKIEKIEGFNYITPDTNGNNNQTNN